MTFYGLMSLIYHLDFLFFSKAIRSYQLFLFAVETTAYINIFVKHIFHKVCLVFFPKMLAIILQAYVVKT